MKRWIILSLSFIPMVAGAAVKSEPLIYKHGGATLNGVLFYDDAVQEKRPGVLVVHEWKGLDNVAKKHAEEVAGLGYVALAVDIYGDGKVLTTNEEAHKLSTFYKSDRNLMRGRMMAALKALKGVKQVNPNKIASIGYCFGGTSSLELARSGADVKGVVSFHGNLNTPTPDDAKNIKCKILVLHGADDPFSNAAEVSAFADEMKKAKVDYQLVLYSNTVHGFTNPEGGNNIASGYAYNETSGKRAWGAMKQFFNEIFGG